MSTVRAVFLIFPEQMIKIKEEADREGVSASLLMRKIIDCHYTTQSGDSQLTVTTQHIVNQTATDNVLQIVNDQLTGYQRSLEKIDTRIDGLEGRVDELDTPEVQSLDKGFITKLVNARMKEYLKHLSEKTKSNINDAINDAINEVNARLESLEKSNPGVSGEASGMSAWGDPEMTFEMPAPTSNGKSKKMGRLARLAATAKGIDLEADVGMKLAEEHLNIDEDPQL